MSIRVDLHVHSKVTVRSSFEIEAFEATVRRARRLGLSGFALTEHVHHPDFWANLHVLRERYEYGDGRFAISPGFGVLTGMELTVAEKADVVLIGDIGQMLHFDRSLAPSPSLGYNPPFRDIFTPARQAGLVMIGAHPTKVSRGLLKRLRKHLARLDALEVNGNQASRRDVEPDTRKLARALDLPVVGGSDAHVWSQVGVVTTVLDLPELTQEGLRRCIADRSTEVRQVKNLRSIVRVSRAHRRILQRGGRPARRAGR